MPEKNKTRYVLLGLLKDEELSGYEIKRIIDTRLSFFWNESFGQIYPVLKKLTFEGLISLSEHKRKSSKESKKYAITEKGRKELDDWLLSPVEKELIRYEILLKLYFSDASSSCAMMQNIKEFELIHKRQLELFSLFETQLKQDLDLHSNHRQILMVLSFGQRVWEAYMNWCQETINVLGSMDQEG